MPTIKIPTPLRYYTNNQAEVVVRGTTVAEAMDNLVEQYPNLRTHLYNGDGALRPFVNLFLNKTNIRDLQGLETPLGENDQLMIIPSIAGGKGEKYASSPHP